MRVLVAGGAGYIGSHTCKALARAGHTPIVFDNLRTGHAWAVEWGLLEQGDLNDRSALDGVMRRHRPESALQGQPRHSDLGDIIGHAWKWMSQHRARVIG